MFDNALFRVLELKLYSITILRTILYGEIICGVDNMYYNCCSSRKVNFSQNSKLLDQYFLARMKLRTQRVILANCLRIIDFS